MSGNEFPGMTAEQAVFVVVCFPALVIGGTYAFYRLLKRWTGK